MTGLDVAPYGPNTPAIRRFLVRFAALGTAQRAMVVAAYAERAESTGWMRAELQLGETMESSGRTDIPDAIAGPLMQLVRTPGDTGSDDAIDPIAEPALAALLSIAVADLLPAQAQATLYAPFAATIPFEELGMRPA
jgi:hypothetical protein